MPCSASFVNWNDDPLTRIPCSRARDHGRVHEKRCGCDRCAAALAQAREDLRRNIQTLSALLKMPVPALLAKAEPKSAALYACWFDLRNEFIKEVNALRIQYPASTEQVVRAEARRRPLTNYSILCPVCRKLVPCILVRANESISESCVTCGHVYQVRTVETLRDLLTLGPDADRLADEALRQRLIRPHAAQSTQYVEPYKQPQRITEFHESRSHGRAAVRQAQAAYRAKE